MTLVLIVDDEPQIRKALRINLEARDYRTVEAEDGRTAVRLAADRNPDLVLLDLGLPDLDGTEVIAAIRGWSRVPIIVLTARGEERSKVDALDAGADDYVTKPFGINELLARIRASLRRTVTSDRVTPQVATPDFTIDFARRTVTRTAGGEIRLTPIEWGIVEHLVVNEERLVSHRSVVDAVWGPAHRTDANLLRVHMTHIRAKLEPDPPNPRYFVTEPGMGFRFVTR